ncbi:MAG: hypothetical protein HY556_10185 [Euryarchaeota archaeon]|nr:hypothetical protein [Euryarchaeota archaeon]
MTRRGMLHRRDSAVVNVLGAILVIAGIVAFLTVFNLNFVPAWAADWEASHSDSVRTAMSGWADAAEDHISRELNNRSFSRNLPAGTAGLPILGAGQSSGSIRVETAPTITVGNGATTVFTASGAMAMTTSPSHFEAQTFRYVLGALEVNQSRSSYVDLRSLITAQRTGAGKLYVTVQAPTIGGGSQDVASGGDIQVLSTVTGITRTTQATGNAHLLIDNVAAYSWRSAFNRTFGAANLTGENIADCTASTQHFCYDSDTNDVDTVDLYVMNAATGWTTITGDIRVEVRG